MTDQPENMSSPTERKTGWFVPWKTDSIDMLEAGNRHASLTKLRLIRPIGLDEFLANVDSTAQTLVGARGCGKSLVLAMKAAQVREQLGKSLGSLMGHHPYVNRLSRAQVRIPLARMGVFSDHSSWVRIWTLLLGSVMAFVILRKEDIPSDPNDEGNRIESLVRRFFGCQPAKHSDKPGPFEFFVDVGTKVFAGKIEVIVPLLQHLIGIGLNASHCQDWFDQYVLPVLERGNEDSHYVAYVDGIDEMLADSEGGELFPTFGAPLDQPLEGIGLSDNERQLASGCWIAAQTGFIDCVVSLREQTLGRVRIYGAAREEVYARYLDSSVLGAIKAKQRLLPLVYSHDELQAIFDLNVEFTAEKADPSATSSTKQLFGFEEIRSAIVWNHTESVLQHIIRHTFGSPRHLVEVACAAKDAVRDPLLRSDPGQRRKIILAINEAARSVLAEYKQAVLPRWAKAIDPGLALIESNVLSKSQAAGIEWLFSKNDALPKEHFDDPQNWSLFPCLYSRGLIGLPKADLGGEFVLNFQKPNGREKSLPREIDYLALHPTLAAEICASLDPGKQLSFYSSELVVGDGLAAPRLISPKAVTVQFERNLGLKVLFGKEEFKSYGSDDRAVQQFLVVVSLLMAIRRHGSSFVPLGRLEEEARLLIDQLKGTSLAAAIPMSKAATGRPSEPMLLAQIRRGLNYSAAEERPRIVKKIKPLLESHGLHWSYRRGTPPSFGLEWLVPVGAQPAGKLLEAAQIEVRMF